MASVKKTIALVLACALIATGSLGEKIKGIFLQSEESEPECEDVTPKRGKNSPTNKNEDTAATFCEICDVMSDGVGWYCKHMNDGTRPPLPTEMSYITEHNGYYLGKDEPVIYLTFDAGYENGNVEKILDTLHEENVPGAFFILDNLVKTNTDLVRRMIDEGHTVCNHTAKHKDMTKMSSIDDFSAELKAMEDIYRETMGVEISKYYRPPEGRFNEENLSWASELGYKTIFWSFAYADWDNDKQMSCEAAKEKIISNTHNGAVILLHPTSKTNAEILPELIKTWRKMGYTFGTLDNLCEKSVETE